MANKPKRNAKGQFVKGEKGISPGRPRRQTEAEYLDTLRETVTLDDWREICIAMVNKAKDGDVRAFEALCKWAMPQEQQNQAVPVFAPPNTRGLN